MRLPVRHSLALGRLLLGLFLRVTAAAAGQAWTNTKGPCEGSSIIVHRYMHKYMCIDASIYIYIHINYTYIYMYVYVYIYRLLRRHTQVFMYMRAYTYNG